MKKIVHIFAVQYIHLSHFWRNHLNLIKYVFVETYETKKKKSIYICKR